MESDSNQKKYQYTKNIESIVKANENLLDYEHN